MKIKWQNVLKMLDDELKLNHTSIKSKDKSQKVV